jgi:DNA-binding NarL/FixJ family response regulator
MTRRARILLADDHALLTEALARLLEPRFEIVGTAADGHALVSKAKELKPDVVLIDIAMPMLDGIEAGRLLREELPACKLIFLTMAQDPELAAEVIRIGASAYVLKTSAGWELVQAIEGALRGRTYVTPSLRRPAEGQNENGDEHPSRTALTARQREVLELLAGGRSMKQVAAALGVTIRTVAFHKYEVMQKFRLGSNAELVQFAIRHGIIKP